jgi:uncharacterized membrane protein YphA (DoxX/SURF4 family)
MKRFLDNDYLTFAARVIVGFVLVLASFEKIVDPQAFASSVANYKILPSGLLPLVATILPWMELLGGLALLFGIMHRGAAALAGTMLVLFTVAVGSALLRGLDISCGCFTQDPAAEKIGWLKLLENLGLFLLCLYVLFSTSSWCSLERRLSDASPSRRVSA